MPRLALAARRLMLSALYSDGDTGMGLLSPTPFTGSRGPGIIREPALHMTQRAREVRVWPTAYEDSHHHNPTWAAQFYTSSEETQHIDTLQTYKKQFSIMCTVAILPSCFPSREHRRNATGTPRLLELGKAEVLPNQTPTTSGPVDPNITFHPNSQL